MKYSVFVLACVLGFAAAQFNNGQYVPEKQYNYNRYNQYNKYDQYNPNKPYYNRYQQYQNNPYNKPSVSSTPFPKLFVSSTPAPSTVTPARISYFGSTKSVIPAPTAAAPVVGVAKTVASTNPAAESTVSTKVVAKDAFATFQSRFNTPVPSSIPARSVFPSRTVSPAPSATPSWSKPAWSWASNDAKETPVVAVAPAAKAVQVETPAVSVIKEVPVETPVTPAAKVAPVVSMISVAPVAPVAKTISVVPVPKYYGDARASETLKFDNQIKEDGAFEYAYETNNGIVVQEHGAPRSFYSGEDKVSPVVAEGSYRYVSPEGQETSMTYVADENGYFPSGSAISPQLARALEYIRRNLAVSH